MQVLESSAAVGAVVIGRNEGDRLRRCLESLRGRVRCVVYVDSGSTDNSVATASALGTEIVTLDMSKPFTAARARNEGFARLRALQPDVRFVQFVDGDCEVVPGWLEGAAQVLRERPKLAVVCGRRRERYPEASIYNRLCDMEWDTPVGPALACGGDALMRAAVLAEVGGFNPELIAGEEPELCVRIRAAGYGVERLALEMTLHDAAMMHLGQWWKRAVRAGHAFAEGSHLHGSAPERHWVKESRRAVFWGGALPTVALLCSPLSQGRSLLLLAGYPVSAARVYMHARRVGRTKEDALCAAAFTTLGKLPEFQGLLRFHWGRLVHKRSTLIEYKGN
jgi:Glycosyl transferase family 2